MPKITDLKAIEVLDSRGFPTLEVELVIDNRIYSRSLVPSGASTGAYEALEKRDGDPHRFAGKGVLEAIRAVNEFFCPLLKGWNCLDLVGIDAALCELDGTPNKGRLGANAILAVSMAVAKAGSKIHHMPFYRYIQGFYKAPMVNLLPVPYVNILNGGMHANNRLDIQEFMIVPTGQPCFSEALRVCCETFYALKEICLEKGLNTNVGDEGGLAPDLPDTHAALDLLSLAIERAGYSPGKHVSFALDVAASSLLKEDGHYHLDGQSYTSSELIDFYEKLSHNYPIVSIEDGLGEEDWAGWRELTERLGERVQIVGDDLFVTSCKRLDKGIREKAANAVLIKPNQVGTMTETLETCSLARDNRWNLIVSHRSGETEEAFLADLAVALGCGKIKTGGVTRGERTAKYNKLLRIEKTFGKKGSYAGAL